MKGMYMVPVWGYDNFLAVSKFSEYLDSMSGALHDTEYCIEKAKIISFMHKKDELQRKVQKFCDLEQKTEAMHDVPVWGYDNFLAVSNFAEYLDSLSGKLQDTEYCIKRERIISIMHNKGKLQRQSQKFSDLDDSQNKTEAMRLEEGPFNEEYAISKGQQAMQIERSTQPCNTPDKIKITQQEQTNRQNKGCWVIKKQQMKSKMSKLFC